MERADFAPEFPLEWALKDVGLAVDAAGGDTLPLLNALSRHRAAVADGHGREDVSAARLALRRHRLAGTADQCSGRARVNMPGDLAGTQPCSAIAARQASPNRARRPWESTRGVPSRTSLL